MACRWNRTADNSMDQRTPASTQMEGAPVVPADSPLAAGDPVVLSKQDCSSVEAGSRGSSAAAGPFHCNGAGVTGDLTLTSECGPFTVFRLLCTYMRTQVIRFLFIRMSQALWIWVGDQKELLADLEAAFPMGSRGGTQAAACTCLFSSNIEASSGALASKLAARFGQPVFLSVNVAGADGPLMIFIQQVLQDKISSILARGADNPTKLEAANARRAGGAHEEGAVAA
ncbi:hypothetical protein CSUI_009997 [Cystoisospora suis]|uniref:Proteasome assembly chaperone 4 n=1 Tax=Cystoisospora suis TaxID=483139 RepID=A0A2C6KHQ8_9APIC|nr:hypothetical protein CSUI_009997 [Cystoisospora suis]